MLPTTRLRLMICIAIAVLRAEEVLELVPHLREVILDSLQDWDKALVLNKLFILCCLEQ